MWKKLFATHLEDDASLDALRYAERELQDADPKNERTIKLYAEVCYLLARYYRDAGVKNKALEYGNKAIELYGKLEITTLEDAVPVLFSHLPDLMHKGVVKQRILDAVRHR